jgi:hypothetical protein
VCLIRCGAVALALALPVAPAAFAGDEPGPRDVHYDHQKGGQASITRDLKNGDQMTVFITHTCPTQFEYEIRGYEKETPPAATAKAVMGLSTKKLPLVHDSKYGGYVVSIRRIEGKDPCTEAGNVVNLESQTFLILVREATWDLSFTGGFTVSSLKNPVYAFKTDADGRTKHVVEDTDKVDAATLGIAAFVHVYHQKHPWIAPAFGIGIRTDNKTEYYIGGAFRMNDKAAINAGVVFGPVTTLPAGVKVGDTVTDNNTLNNLPTRTGRGFFVAFSYSFLNARGALEKPFAGAGAAAPAATGRATGGGESKPCAVSITKDDLVKATLAAAGGTQEIKLTATGSCDWKTVWLKPDGKTAMEQPDWVTEFILKHEGTEQTGTAKITVSANATKDPRTAKLRLGAADTEAIQLTQRGKD